GPSPPALPSSRRGRPVEVGPQPSAFSLRARRLQVLHRARFLAMTRRTMAKARTIDFRKIAASDGPQAAYRALVQAGTLTYDPSQALAVEMFQHLSRALRSYKQADADGWRARLGLLGGSDAPNGLYVYGVIGRGKSTLMDLFFAATPVEKKRRVEFAE